MVGVLAQRVDIINNSHNEIMYQSRYHEIKRDRRNKRIKETATTALYIIATVVAIVLALDVLGAMLWALSGQVPPADGYFAGAITRSIINFII